MPIYVVGAAVAVVLSVPVLWMSLSAGRTSSGRVSQNLTTGLDDSHGDLRRLVLSQPWRERILQPVVGFLARRTRRLSPSGFTSSLERQLDLSGVSWPMERVLAAKVGLGAVLLAGSGAWALMSPSGLRLLATLGAGACGFLLPDALIARKARERQLAIANDLADTLDQLTVCVEAGLGFDSALARVAKSSQGPLGRELVRMMQELHVGVPRSQGFENLLARTDVPELRQFVHAIRQAEVYGVAVAAVLRSQALEQREKRRQKAEERAMKMPVKVIFPLVFCILPTMFIVIIGPAMLRIGAIFK